MNLQTSQQSSESYSEKLAEIDNNSHKVMATIGTIWYTVSQLTGDGEL